MEIDGVQARMRSAFELHALAVAMRREALAREHPDEPPERIEARLREWVLDPGPPPTRLAERGAGR